MRKKVLVLGSTGSIGRATLEVIENQKDDFLVFGLVCKGNVDLLNEQIVRFKPQVVCIFDDDAKDRINVGTARLLTGMDGIREMIHMDVDVVVNALPGSIGLEPTIDTLKARKTLALANKESLVMAGRIIVKLLRENGARLIPVDSEHSAVFQILKAAGPGELKTIMITASGGPFRDHGKETLKDVRPEEALNHPTWKMGKKITLDSATLMNKGLEVIEARWLFDVEPSRIKVLVHPESILHGIIELIDGSVIAYMAHPDMKIPISYALNEEKRFPLPFGKMRLEDVRRLTFYPPDTERFPSLRLAYEALEVGDSAVIAMNASNEVASAAFMDGKISFTDIPRIIEKTLEQHPKMSVIESTEAIWEVHGWAEAYTKNILRTYHG
jgi:1-deoxy-D-xylulose-5-phosphate reductoisomerase